ncbi:hypothetical protein AVEN_148272-1 [Araneus ventricosus]|uniref:Uncharacterized protein n=1 Tax=Araneus ventricosus TaxID=182803 RepID=A0A4Y2HJZ7_ARAVE|nr:hypothetical protein AVEN_148272-1 [Araneus ventricosus]
MIKDIRSSSPYPNFRITPTRGRLVPAHHFTCNKPIKQRIFSGIGFRGWKTLTLGHRVPSFSGMMRKARSCAHTENDKTSAGCRWLSTSFAENHQLQEVPVTNVILLPIAHTDFCRAIVLMASSLSFHKSSYIFFKKI